MVASLLFALVAAAVPPSPDDEAAHRFASALESMYDKTRAMDDCTFRFYSEEWVDGEVNHAESFVRYRREFDVFLHYDGGEHAGRRIVWRGDEVWGGKLRVDPGRLLPTVSIDPDGRLARRGNRHSIRDLPLPRLADKIVADALKVRDHPRWEPDVTWLGTSTVRGEPAECYRFQLPKHEDPTLYGSQVELCINPDTGLPNSVEVWDVEDGALRKVEDYDYIGVEVNVGLTDADFEL